MSSFDSVWQDLRYTVRQLRAHPVFSAAAILTLALGIGANSAIYNLLHRVLFEPLPVPSPQELVILQPYIEGNAVGFSYPQVQALAERQTVAERIFGSSSFPITTSAIEGRTLRSAPAGNFATAGYFEGLGAVPGLGRLLTEADHLAGSEPVVVLSHRFWQREFASSST